MKAMSKTAPESRWWDSLAALLLMCALLTAATRLVVTQWTEDLYTIQTLVFLGAVLGLALGQSRFSARKSALIALGYSLFLIPWQLGAPLAESIQWKERLVILFERLANTIDLLVRSRPVNDNILFLLLMSMLFWWLGVQAGYSITRHASPWRAVVPTGLAIIVIHSYDPLIARRAWFLAAYLLFALLLMARITFIQQRVQWRDHRTYVPPDIGFDWIRFTLAAAVLLIMLAWTAPALAESLPAARDAWNTARRPWVEFQDRMSNAFASLQASVGLVSEYYGSSMSLGRGSELSDDLVMSVEAPPRPVPGMRYYWRAYTYDRYEEGEWKSTFTDSIVVNPNDPNILQPDLTGRRIATFTFAPRSTIVTLFTAPQPVWVSVPATAYVANNEDGTIDLAAYQATSAIPGGQNYEVRSSLTAVTVAQLREAGTEYPEWVTERYLQLPPDITPRTIDLAERVSADMDNPYDVAAAVTDFLRTYEYREVIDPPPTDGEVLDWWLFDYKAGFCVYYASAEVVMLRALGIPARMAVGYAQGEFEGRGRDTPPEGGSFTDPEDFTDQGGNYLVRQSDAHTWPEVYFPGIGWVEFEPTAGQAEIARPMGAYPDGTPLSLEEEERERRELERLRDLMDFEAEQDLLASGVGAGGDDGANNGLPMWVALPPLTLIVFLLFAWRRRRMPAVTPFPVRLERRLKRLGFKSPAFLQKWAYRASLSPLTTAYNEINRALKRLGSPAAVDDTPAERASSLVRLLPVAEESIQSLLFEYHLSTYSLKSANELVALQAAAQIRKLSYRSILRALFMGKEEAFTKAHN